ncbi:MAG: hypothetical protein K6F99_05645 [Lachnospiraceae bacterium]|nr:hypothetical protein [Lachnospiraceae bacterium]
MLPPEQVDQSIPKTLQREHQAFGEMLDSLSKEDEERFKQTEVEKQWEEQEFQREITRGQLKAKSILSKFNEQQAAKHAAEEATEKKMQSDYKFTHGVKENVERLRSALLEADPGLLNEIDHRVVHELKHRPARTALVKEYAANFGNILTDQKRVEKQRNKKSELNRKLRNVELLKAAVAKNGEDRIKQLSSVITKDQALCSIEEFEQFSAFMTGDAAQDGGLATLFLGKNKKKGADTYEGRDTQQALNLMVTQILSVDVSKLRLDNDDEIAAHAGSLEELSKRMAAFDQLAEKYNYMDSIRDMKDTVSARLNSLRYIVNYYELKKEIMTDDYYKNHYNRELSMDFTAKGLTVRQRLLAQKLAEANILGKKMMEANGVRADIIAKRGKPKYQNEAKANELEANFAAKYSENGNKTLIRNRAAEHAMDNTKVIDAMKETAAFKEEERLKQAEKSAKEQKRETIQKAQVKRENIVKNKMMQDIAIENVLNTEMRKELMNNYQEKAYSEEELKKQLEEFKAIDIKALKFDSFGEILKNFKNDVKVYDKALSIHLALVRGIMHGFTLPDNELNELKIKFQVLFEMRCTAEWINKMVLNDSFLENNEEQMIQALKAATKGKEYAKPRISALPGKIDECMAKSRTQVMDEYANREKGIKTMWKLINPNPDDSEIPEGELEKRKEEFVKNGLIYEYFGRQDIVHGPDFDTSSAYRIAYMKKHNIKEVDIKGRFILDAISGYEPAEKERLLKLSLSKDPMESFEFWKALDDQMHSMLLKDFDTRDFSTFFDNYERKRVMCELFGNLDSIIQGYKSALNNEKLKGKIKLPDRYKSLDDCVDQLTKLRELSQGYIGGRIKAYSLLNPDEITNGLSPEELGNFSREAILRMIQIRTAVSENYDGHQEDDFEHEIPYPGGEKLSKEKIKKRYEDDPDFEGREVNNLERIQVQSNFISPERVELEQSEEEKKAGKQRKSASYELSLDDIFKDIEKEYDRKTAEARKKDERSRRKKDENGVPIKVIKNQNLKFADEFKAEYQAEGITSTSKRNRKKIKHRAYLNSRYEGTIDMINSLAGEEGTFLENLLAFELHLDHRNAGYDGKGMDIEDDNIENEIERLVNELKESDLYKTRNFETDNWDPYLKSEFLDRALDKLDKEVTRRDNAVMRVNENEFQPLNQENPDVRVMYKHNHEPEDQWDYEFAAESGVRIEDAKNAVAAKGLFSFLGVGDLMTDVQEKNYKDADGNTHYGFGVKVISDKYQSYENIMNEFTDKTNVKVQYEPKVIKDLSSITLMNALLGNTKFEINRDVKFHSEIRRNSKGENIVVLTDLKVGPILNSFGNIGGSALEKKHGSLPAFDDLNLPLIDINVAEAIMKMKPEDIDTFAGGCMDDKQRSLFAQRLEHIQGKIKVEGDYSDNAIISGHYFERGSKRRILWDENDYRLKINSTLLKERIKDNKQFYRSIMKNAEIVGTTDDMEDKCYNTMYSTLSNKIKLSSSTKVQYNALKDFVNGSLHKVYGKEKTIGGEMADDIYTRVIQENGTKKLLERTMKESHANNKKLNELYLKKKEELKGKPLPEELINKEQYELKFDKEFEKAKAAKLEEMQKEYDEAVKADKQVRGALAVEDDPLYDPPVLLPEDVEELKTMVKEQLAVQVNDELEKWIGLEICKENPELISNIRNNRQIMDCFFNQVTWVNRTGDPDMDDPMYTQSKILEENKDLEGFAEMQTFANELELAVNPESIRQDKTFFDMSKLVDAFKMSEEKATEKAKKDQNMLFTKKFIDNDIKALDKSSRIKQNKTR